MKATTYEKLLKEVEELQGDLMTIPDYNEDVYQAFEKLISELEWTISPE